MTVLYIRAGRVIASHDRSQLISSSAYAQPEDEAGAVMLMALAAGENWTFGDDTPEETAPRVAATKAFAKELVTALAQAAGLRVTGVVPIMEALSWNQKAIEAAAFTANANATTPMLSAEIAITGEARGTLAARVLAKSTAFAMLAGTIAGRRRAAETAIDAAETLTEIAEALDTASDALALIGAA